MRGSKHALVVVDMPFGSYEESPQIAFRNAARVMQETGCTAVKMEGGARLAETVNYLTQRGIPVMGHIGLTPQSFNVMGGFKTQGRTEAEWPAIEADAKAVAEAGAFAVVLEGMAEPLAAKITQQIAIPTIGIGASARVRRPDPGDGGHAGPQSQPAEIRAPIRQPRPGHRDGGQGLCRRRARAPLPGQGKCLRHEKGRLTGLTDQASCHCPAGPANYPGLSKVCAGLGHALRPRKRIFP